MRKECIIGAEPLLLAISKALRLTASPSLADKLTDPAADSFRSATDGMQQEGKVSGAAEMRFRRSTVCSFCCSMASRETLFRALNLS